MSHVSGVSGRNRRALTSATIVVIAIAGGLLGTARSAFAVQFPPQLSKSFAPSAVAQGGNATLRFVVYNPEPNNPLINVSFTDNLPAGLVVATPPNVTGPDPACGGVLVAAPGSGTVSLSGGTVPGGGFECDFSVAVTATTLGLKHNVTSQLTADTTKLDETISPGDPAIADLQVGCTRTLTGVMKSLSTGPGTTCVTDAIVSGSVTVNPGTGVIIKNSAISGGMTATNPSGFQMCGSRTGSPVNVSGSSGFVLIGDPRDGCSGNTIGAAMTLSNNTAGVQVSSNRIGGSLSCAGNSAVTNDGQPNTVGGTRSGQCVGL